MAIIRTEKQVALQNLQVLLCETVDLYRDAAHALDDARLSEALLCIAGNRERLIPPLEAAIRATDDLPATPDADKETWTKLLDHVLASLSSDAGDELLRNRLTAEDRLDAAVAECRQVELETGNERLLMDVADNIEWTKRELQRFLEKQRE